MNLHLKPQEEKRLSAGVTKPKFIGFDVLSSGGALTTAAGSGSEKLPFAIS